MCTATSNNLGKITSSDEIWSWAIQKLISIFSETVKDRVIKFSLMIDLSKNPSRILIYLAIRRKTYSLLATRTFLAIIIILPYFCDRDFSEMAGSILIIFGRVIGVYMNLIHFLHFWKITFSQKILSNFVFQKWILSANDLRNG
jgi:hypothetical protein